MGKSEGYTPEECCPSCHVDALIIDTAATSSHVSKSAPRSDELQESNNSKTSGMQEPSAASKSPEVKQPKPNSGSKKLANSTTGEECQDVDHESSLDVEPKESEQSKLKLASKSRRSEDTSTEDAYHDIDHESSTELEAKELKKSKSALQLRKTTQSNSVENPYQHTDHNTVLPPEKSPLPEILVEAPSEPEECSNADHDQPTDGHTFSAVNTKPDAAEQIPNVVRGETDTAPRSARRSSKKVERLVDKLNRRSSINERCFDSDYETHPDLTKKVRKEKAKVDKKIKRDLKEIDKKVKKEKKKNDRVERKRIQKQEKQERREMKAREKKDKKKRKQIDKQEKKDKITVMPVKPRAQATSEDQPVDAYHWLSPSDAKKLQKLIKSRDERQKKNEEYEKILEDRLKGFEQSEHSKLKGKNKAPYIDEHRLSGCEVIQTNDGPSDFDPSATQTPAQAFPRGLQIMAKNTNTLEGGFPYPKELAPFGISKADWSVFCLKLTEPLVNQKIAYAIEKVLDICAEEDVMFFRPKGFILRLDMPGEEEYGLDMMDIYHAKFGSIHTDNFTTMPKSSSHKEPSGAIKHKHHVQEKSKDRKHLESLRDKAFRSTRLIIDPIIVLKDPELATQRGWAAWIIACKQAQQLAAEAPPKRMDNKPWHGYFPGRWDRWPPSKHLYYDRFRGAFHATGTNKHPNSCFIPDYDSMDQRGSPYTSSVIPCDQVEFAVLHPDQP